MAPVKAKTAQEYHSDATRLTSRLFWAPPPRMTIVPAIALSILGGLLVAAPALDWQVIRYAVALFGVPTFLAAVFAKSLVDLLGGKTYLRRTSLLALVGLGISVGTFALARASEAVYWFAIGGRWDFHLASPFRLILLSWSVPLWLSLLVFLSTSDSRTSRSLPPASVQTISAYLIALLFLPSSSWDVLFAVLVFFFFTSTALLLASVANRPMRRSFGYNGLWLMGQFLDHMTERGPAARQNVEGFFEAISVPSKVHIGAIAFGSPPKFNIVIVVPSAHPGPLGSLGGSDLPRKLAEQLADITPAVLELKGPSTHDQNIATTSECSRIGEKVRELLRGSKLSSGGSKSATATVGKATAHAQFFGDSALVVGSLAPNPTDDIDSPTGHAARQEAKAAGAREVLFVDAHNCMEVGSGLTHFGSSASHDLVEASRKAVEAAKALRVGAMRVGYASKPYTANPDDGLGSMGVQVLVVEAGDQKTAYILFDGNNMACGLREKVMASVRDVVDTSEVLTSDDHSVNMTMGGFNPVGMKMDHDGLANTARELTEAAVRGLSPTQNVLIAGVIDDLKVFGPESSARLTTGINLTVAVLKPAVALSLSLAVSLSLLALFLIP